MLNGIGPDSDWVEVEGLTDGEVGEVAALKAQVAELTAKIAEREREIKNYRSLWLAARQAVNLWQHGYDMASESEIGTVNNLNRVLGLTDTGPLKHSKSEALEARLCRAERIEAAAKQFVCVYHNVTKILYSNEQELADKCEIIPREVDKLKSALAASGEGEACPWCKSKRLVVMSGNIEKYWVACAGCGTPGPLGDTRELARTAWNTRYPLEELTACHGCDHLEYSRGHCITCHSKKCANIGSKSDSATDDGHYVAGECKNWEAGDTRDYMIPEGMKVAEWWDVYSGRRYSRNLQITLMDGRVMGLNEYLRLIGAMETTK